MNPPCFISNVLRSAIEGKKRLTEISGAIKSDERALQTVLREIETETLVLALKGAAANLRDKLLGCVSQRAAANIMDEMEAMGPVRLSQVQDAQKQISPSPAASRTRAASRWPGAAAKRWSDP